jgi:hypothetical protein
MANSSDKITDVRNAARPNSARVSTVRTSGATTLQCDNLVGWPTASKVHFVTYQIDSNSNPVSGTQLDCSGIVSGNNIGTLTVIDGTDNGNSVGDVVEMLPTAAWGQDLADALTVGHTRTGAHVSALPLTSPILTTPTIADYTNATHTHAGASTGGQLVGSAALTNSSVTANKLSTGASLGTVATSETTSSVAFTDLATPGPAVTVTIGANGLALVSVGADMFINVNGAQAFVGIALSGATTQAAAIGTGLHFQPSAFSNNGYQMSWVTLYTGLAAGSTTFTAKYRTDGNIGTYAFRNIVVIPL